MANQPLEVHMFPCLGDNFCYLIHDSASGQTAVVDTPEVRPIEAALAEKGWQLTHILNTHHHPDHAGGNLALKERTGCKILGAKVDAARIPGIDVELADGQEFDFAGHKVQVWETPGHTVGHIVFHFVDDDMAFVGDTLFSLGCGRLFEGGPDQMWSSMQKLLKWPDQTLLYCAHEYTQSNARFAITVEPQNPDLQARVKEVDRLRAEGKWTVPTSLALEKKTNPFLRPDSAALQENLGLVGSSLVDVFAETRLRKDNA